MKMKHVMVALALMLPLSSAWAVTPDPESLPKVACSDFKFSSAFLDRYPKAPAACQDGRVYKGHKYAKFNAKVYLTSHDKTTLQVLGTSGDPVGTVTIKPPAGTSLVVDGKKMKFSDLKTGDQLTIWVPESRMSVSTTPGATASPILASPKE